MHGVAALGLGKETGTMEIAELIEQLKNPGEEGAPITAYDDILSIHEGALASGAEASAAKDATIAELTAEVSRLKAANYDLLTAGSVPEVEEDTADDEDDEDDDATSGIDGLFEGEE